MQRKEEMNTVIDPERGTPALLEYLWSSTCDFRLFHFVIDTTLASDYAAHVVKQALAGNDAYKSIDPTSLAKDDPGRRTRALRASSQEMLEMFLVRSIDNFQIYLVEAIRAVLHKQPRVLADRKLELSLGQILKFESIDALAKDIVEGKLQSLSYQGFGELEDWCTSRSIPLVVPDGMRPKLVELIALRNIIVHNRGRIDERYADAVPGRRSDIGKKRTIDVDDLLDAIDMLDRVACVTDSALAGKFSLEQIFIRKELSTRSKERWGPLGDTGKSDARPQKAGPAK
jgi:hypothetical protein